MFSELIAANSNFEKAGLAEINDPDGYTNVRSGPGENYPIIGKILNKEEFYFGCDTVNANWLRVQKMDSMIGFMHKSKIRLVKLLRMKSCDMSLIKQVDSLNSWNKIFEFYSKYQICDDGAIAEGLSDAIANMFSNKWSKINEFSELAVKDTIFFKFALSHIDLTASNIADFPRI
jgi:uncharacterized protein YgiM (DUF1202 family)